ncbi:MAG: cupin domain-containing protein [Thermoleophilia bacterium]|nr:cupin domain-containing protein [Thermoleophilia bacterium]
MDKPRPMVVPLASVPPVPAGEAVTKVRIARLVTRERCGSGLLTGVSWMDPGEETNTWSSRPENDMGPGDHWYGPVEETYFIVRGRLELAWDEGVLELGPDDAVFLAPGWTYRLRNVGDEPAFFVYSMTPTPE